MNLLPEKSVATTRSVSVYSAQDSSWGLCIARCYAATVGMTIGAEFSIHEVMTSDLRGQGAVPGETGKHW